LEADARKSGTLTHLTRGYLICFCGVVIWSLTGIFIRYLTETYQMPPLVLAFWRDLLVAVALLLVFAVWNRALLKVERGNLRFLLLYGLEISLFNSLWTISVALNGAAVATVLIYSSAAFTAILGWRLFGERLGSYKIVAVSLSLIGCIFVAGAYDLDIWRGTPVGLIVGLLSGLGFAGYSLMGRAAARRGINSWTTLTYGFTFATPFLLFYNLLGGMLPAGVGSMDFFMLGDAYLGWGILIFLAIGPTLSGFGLYTLSLAYLPASVANLIATLEPVVTAVLAYLLLGERLALPQWLGGILVMGGVLFLRLEERNKSE
jgi:drug/metabolite transporter (DMT)-like permease